jgi:lipopolysaccharide/colanic/teichoic acid biosynthesis glycosyltransferase
VLASVGLLAASPVLAIAAFLIWLEDRGPIFFRQTRIGKNHTPFPLFKLRTMRANAGGDRYTQKDDRRITRVGRFLRASRLDEFPQLVNVLRGEMSMIGPRAEWDVLVRDYEAQIPCYHFRHLVKPASLAGHRSTTPMALALTTPSVNSNTTSTTSATSPF